MILNLGGGGTSLNFDVKAYATEEALLAATPKENTIGIITTNKITGWLFSATEPESPTEGMVWISTGASSTIEFNALKKNGIQVYPLSAKQYVSGAWVDVTAMSYQGGEWVEWEKEVYLFKTGNGDSSLFTAVKGTGMSWISKIEITDESIHLAISNSTYNSGYFYKTEPVDLTDYSVLYFDADTRSNNLKLGVGSSKPSGSGWTPEASITPGSGRVENVVDISNLSGEYYIGGGNGTTNNKVSFETTIYNIWME